MIPHEQLLVDRLKSKPFAIIGVNADDDPQLLKEGLNQFRPTWRSFQNHCEGRAPITSTWKVSGFPTLCLIDHNGILQKKWEGRPDSKELEVEIDRLLRAARNRK